jgi:uncharacterized Zn-finger protein
MMDTKVFDKQYVTHYRVTSSELPFCCPPKSGDKNINHPRVFLNFDTENKATCEYCATNYILDYE